MKSFFQNFRDEKAKELLTAWLQVNALLAVIPSLGVFLFAPTYVKEFFSFVHLPEQDAIEFIWWKFYLPLGMLYFGFHAYRSKYKKLLRLFLRTLVSSLLAIPVSIGSLVVLSHTSNVQFNLCLYSELIIMAILYLLSKRSTLESFICEIRACKNK